jgi:FkbH-like protein
LAFAHEKGFAFRDAVERAAKSVPIALSLPTLPIPPIAYNPGWQEGYFGIRLFECLFSWVSKLSGHAQIRIINRQRLEQTSPMHERLDVRSEIATGFPYRMAHAAALGEVLARALVPPQPKKGLITDLDNTLWSGIVGEIGAQEISWDLDRHSQIHALYQQTINALAATGVLIGVASRNDPRLVGEAFTRNDLIIESDSIFPMEAHWQAKSESVARILRAWNVGAADVVFIDDSPLELAEVQAAFPSMECIQFPYTDDQACYRLFEHLRDLFGKDRISDEDGLRRLSLKNGRANTPDGNPVSVSPDALLLKAEPQLTFCFNGDPPDPRALELVNKTNQFNLNGKRYAEGAWLKYLKGPRTVMMLVTYKDKYGPLGKIAVLTGRLEDDVLVVETWVMSCRAFARRIEYCCLDTLFAHFGLNALVFSFEATDRNTPLQDFLKEMLGEAPFAGARLNRATFARRCPALSHKMRIS